MNRAQTPTCYRFRTPASRPTCALWTSAFSTRITRHTFPCEGERAGGPTGTWHTDGSNRKRTVKGACAVFFASLCACYGSESTNGTCSQFIGLTMQGCGAHTSLLREVGDV